MKDFFEWINDNKVWIFDGIGVLIITSLFAVIKYIFNKRNKDDNKKIVIKQDAYGADDTLIGIQNNYNRGEEDNE